jgi:lipoprotein-releasing system ATP-binding protein
MTEASMLEVCNLSKEYPMPEQPLRILSDINLALSAGSAISIIGPSGSGKSTLLHVIGGLEPPTTGTVVLSGEDPYAMNEKSLAEFRNKKIGFVFQDHHLLPQCTVLENVLVPSLVAAVNSSVQQRAEELLNRVGLSHRMHHRPHELSGGEKQRVALARALVLDPEVILCDEPTGNLDHASGEMVASLLLELHEIRKNILVIVTHNLELADRFQLKFQLIEGRLHSV